MCVCVCWQICVCVCIHVREVIPQNVPWTYMGVAQVCNLVPVPVAVSR